MIANAADHTCSEVAENFAFLHRCSSTALQKVEGERSCSCLHTRTPPTPHRLINSNLIGRGLTSYTRAFGGLVLEYCVSAGGEGRRPTEAMQTRSPSGLTFLTGSWELRLNVGAGGFAEPARGSGIQFVCVVFFFLIAGNFERERSRCTAWLHNTIETLPHTNVYHLIKLEIASMAENNCYFTLYCHSSHGGASLWEISLDAFESCGQIPIGRYC